jgi:hypothetical protein
VDFIERIFHISPDNGNGTLEIAILIAVLLPGVIAALWRRRSRDASVFRSRN